MTIEEAASFQDQWLLCRAGRCKVALPLASVVETMRPMPVETLAGAPLFVRGFAIVRGVPIPVIAAASLLGEPSVAQQTRWVTIRTGARVIAFEVERVLGVQRISKSAGHELPPLARAADAGVISAIGALDSELVLFLESARIVSDALLAALAQEGSPR